jgi:tRNA(Arg) A34 adenosine deaminase TadA
MAILHSRFKRVIYGVGDTEFGGLGTKYDVHCEKPLNHHFEVYKGLCQEECKALLNKTT